jgi:hypothetical protein
MARFGFFGLKQTLHSLFSCTRGSTEALFKFTVTLRFLVIHHISRYGRVSGHLLSLLFRRRPHPAVRIELF